MQTRNHVTLDTAVKLKAAGFPQEGIYAYWVPTFEQLLPEESLSTPWQDCWAAPGPQELADELPHSSGKDNSLEIWSWKTPTGRKWCANYIKTSREKGQVSQADTMAEALAQLWLATHQQGEQEGADEHQD